MLHHVLKRRNSDRKRQDIKQTEAFLICFLITVWLTTLFCTVLWVLQVTIWWMQKSERPQCDKYLVFIPSDCFPCSFFVQLSTIITSQISYHIILYYYNILIYTILLKDLCPIVTRYSMSSHTYSHCTFVHPKYFPAICDAMPFFSQNPIRSIYHTPGAIGAPSKRSTTGSTGTFRNWSMLSCQVILFISAFIIMFFVFGCCWIMMWSTQTRQKAF